MTFVGLPGARADVAFDVTGYFLPNATGATFVSVTPNRLVDSRAGTRLGLSGVASFRDGGGVYGDQPRLRGRDPQRPGKRHRGDG